MSSQEYFIELLNEGVVNIEAFSPRLTKKVARKLIERIEQIKLHLHSYTFILNFQESDFDAIDLLNFAHKENLDGVDISIDDGKGNSLSKKSYKELQKIKLHAKKLGLRINLDISSTYKDEVDSVVRIAKILGVKNIRVYIRYGGHLSEIIKKGIDDLKYIANVAEQNNLFFVLEQHEALKAKELIRIIKKVNSPRINLLFDFGNMVNVNEDPLSALRVMSRHIHQVHVKSIKKVSTKKGYEHIGVPEGRGDFPQLRMFFDLLLLGDFEPQVKFYTLEQEVRYRSPFFRFNKETKNPFIPNREPSMTFLDKNKSVKENLLSEKQNTHKQIRYVKNSLEQMKTLSELMLKE